METRLIVAYSLIAIMVIAFSALGWRFRVDYLRRKKRLHNDR